MLKLTCMVLMCMIVIAPHAQAATSCGMVVTSLAPCLDYLTTGRSVSAACCSGVKSLYGSANTPTDRQDACKYIKSAAASFVGINQGYATSLPGKWASTFHTRSAPPQTARRCSELDGRVTFCSYIYQYLINKVPCK